MTLFERDMLKMKDIDNVNFLLSKITSIGNSRTKSKNQMLVMDNSDVHMCFLLKKGIISIYRSADNLLIRNVSAPIILGLNTPYAENFYYIRAFTHVEYEAIELKNLMKKVEEENLWESLTLYQMWLSGQMFDYLSRMTGMPTREIILHCLYKLNNEPDIIKNTRTAADYIIEKTNLSRSTVMKMLAVLKKEGIVDLSKGLLSNQISPLERG